MLPLVVRIEQAHAPGPYRRAGDRRPCVLVILWDERSAGDGEWAQVMRDWQDARIRKVVRRARGAEWRRAGELPGITVTGKSAEVRVFPPVPLDGWPKELAKLQVSGTDLEETEPPAAARPGVAGALAESGAGDVRGQGDGADRPRRPAGLVERRTRHGPRGGTGLRPRRPHGRPRRLAELTASGLPLVRDAGFTEIAPGSDRGRRPPGPGPSRIQTSSLNITGFSRVLPVAGHATPAQRPVGSPGRLLCRASTTRPSSSRP